MTLLDRLKAILHEEEAEPLLFSDDEDSSLTFAESAGGRVEADARLFRAGDYGKKGKYESADLHRMAANFPASGVPIKDTHIEKDTYMNELLKRHGAKVSRVWVTDDGQELHGAVNVPAWLDEGTRSVDLAKRLSVGLTPDGASLREVSLLLRPHVADAQVFEADMARAFALSDDFTAADEETRAAVLALAPEPKNPAPAPARTEGTETTMTFQEKSKAGLALLTPEQRASVGLTEADIANPLNFAAPETAKADDPRDLFSAKQAAKSAVSALKHEGINFSAPAEDAFAALYVEACKADGGGNITFSADTFDLTTGDKVKALLTVVKDTTKVKLGGGGTISGNVTFGAPDPTGISAQEKYDAALEGRAPVAGK